MVNSEPMNTYKNITSKISLGLIWRVGAATLCRFILNTARRFFYPFAPAISRGLKVPLTAITSLIAINQATGILGMLFGPLADRFGYRIMMLIGMAIFVVGFIASGFLPFYCIVLAGLFLSGLGRNIFEPALQAYIGERVPFDRRGMVVGILEFNWAGTTLLGIPLIGLLIDRMGWRAPFFVLGGLGLVGTVALSILLPREDASGSVTRPSHIGFRKAWRQVVHERHSLGALGCVFFLGLAGDNLFVVYGAWFETEFNLSIVALGFSIITIGVAELLGEFLTAVLADRFGLKQSVIVGLILTTISYGLLPLLGQKITLALSGLFFIYLTLEFAAVCFLSLSTELLPKSRATMMASFYMVGGIGRVAGALIGGPAWLSGGILATSLISSVSSGLALASFVWGLKHWRR